MSKDSLVVDSSSMNIPRRSRIRAFPLLRERLADRQVGHAAVMASLPKGLGVSARAAVQCLWRFEPSAGSLQVQATCDVRASVLGELIDEQEVTMALPGSRWRIAVDFNCQLTPSSDVPVELRGILKQTGRCYRSRKVIVPESDRAEWCLRRLGRHGFGVDPESLQLTPVAIADLGRRGGGIPYIGVSATGAVVDADAWNNALRAGIGAGRSFGLGLVVASAIDEATTLRKAREHELV